MTGPEQAELLSLVRQLRLFGAVARGARRAVRRHAGVPGLPDAQVGVLRMVEANPGVGTRAVAERLRLVPNTVSTLVGELVRSGLLTRVRDEGDRRAARLYLTQEAVDRLALWGSAGDEVLSAVLLRLEEVDRRALGQALPAVRRLLAILDEDEPSHEESP